MISGGEYKVYCVATLPKQEGMSAKMTVSPQRKENIPEVTKTVIGKSMRELDPKRFQFEQSFAHPAGILGYMGQRSNVEQLAEKLKSAKFSKCYIGREVKVTPKSGKASEEVMTYIPYVPGQSAVAIDNEILAAYKKDPLISAAVFTATATADLLQVKGEGNVRP